MTEPVSRAEFSDLQRRVDQIDQGGSRGVAVLAVQIQDLAKDVSGLESKLSEHELQHRAEQRERISDRRWRISVTLTLIATIGGLYPFLYLIVHK